MICDGGRGEQKEIKNITPREDKYLPDKNTYINKNKLKSR